MRKSYLSYLFRRMRDGDAFVAPKMAGKYLGIIYSRHTRKPVSGPLHGSIIITYNCNLRCSMCELWKRPKKYRAMGKELLSTEEMKRVIDDFSAIGTAGIGFTGGEPMLREDMLELIAYTKNKGMITHMSSNGMAINEDSAKSIMASGLDAIGFSLDGATAETHDKIRGVRGSYDRVLNAIEIFSRLNRESKQKIIIIVVTVISTLNLDEILDIVELLKNVGVDKASFLPFHDIGVLSGDIPSMGKHKITSDEVRLLDKVIDRLIEIKKTEDIIDSSSSYLRLFKYCFREMQLPIPCYAGYATFAVDGYGDMYPCFPMMEIGMAQNVMNIRDIPLKEYWLSHDCQQDRDAVRDCRKCYWNNQTELSLLFHPRRVKDIHC